MARKKYFDKKVFTGKKTIYVASAHQGIKAIYDWHSEDKGYIKRTKGNKYYCFKRSKSKKQVSQCFASLDQAKAWRASPDIDPPVDSSATLREVYSRYIARSKSKVKSTTIETYIAKSMHFGFLWDYAVCDITPKVVDRWLTHIKSDSYLANQHKTRVTYKHELGQLRMALDYYAEYENDQYRVPIKKRHREDCIVHMEKYQIAKNKNKNQHIPSGALQQFFSSFNRHVEGMDLCVELTCNYVAKVQFALALRIGEACALKWEDIDFKTKEISINKTVHWHRQRGKSPELSLLPKTNKTRLIESDMAISVLREWQLLSGKRYGLVFCNEGKIIKYRSIQHFYDKHLKRAGLKFTGTHILRHSFSTDFMAETGNAQALRGILGHSSLQQSMHYASVTKGVMSKGMKAYEAQKSSAILGIAGTNDS